MNINGVEKSIININKPKGWTSFDVVKKIRKITGLKKVGHGGTLDLFASGVLLILLGKATKQMNEILKLPKEYLALLELGSETDTLDGTGKIIKTKDIPVLDAALIEDCLNKFTGEIKQKIPNYSAAKISGQRMYKLARTGKDMPAKFKWVTIYQTKLLSFSASQVYFQVNCSSGTYIRTLGADIAKCLGTVGFLQELTRTKIGKFELNNAIDIDNFSNKSLFFHQNECI
jgi:tRNA pseudouridine55 synthase